MINGENAYQSVTGQQKYSTNRVKNSIFIDRKKWEVDLYEMQENYYDTEFESFPEVVQIEIS